MAAAESVLYELTGDDDGVFGCMSLLACRDLPVLLTAAIAVPEMPVKLISLLFCYTLGLMGIISSYATGPGPIYYSSGT
jgi:hypothetical protein